MTFRSKTVWSVVWTRSATSYGWLTQLIEKQVVSVEYNEGNNKRKETVETKATRHSEIHNQLIKPEPPFLPQTSKKYTLVLDLDETLVHYEDDGIVGQFYLRPFAPEFIEEMSKYYELVIFTAALQDYADWIIDRLDEKKRISHRLYRQHTSISGNNYHIKVALADAGHLQARQRPFEDHHRRQHSRELPAASRKRHLHQVLVQRPRRHCAARTDAAADR